MTRRKGTKPEQFAGAFQQYSEIPRRYRLETYAGQYRGQDTWGSYCDQVLFDEYDSNHMRRAARKAGDSWLSHMQTQGRHHALATPHDANLWCQELLDGDRSRRTCYEHYFVRIYQFYDYLKQNHRHPHLYNPLLLAAIEYDTARHLWMFRIDTRPEAVSRE